MATYLKHVPSGDIYPYHELFARDKDFIYCDQFGNTPPAAPPEEPPMVATPTKPPLEVIPSMAAAPISPPAATAKSVYLPVDTIDQLAVDKMLQELE
jgi:hypothetical protein